MQYINGWCEYIDDDGIGVPFCTSDLKPSNYTAPEQWQVVEWLRVNHGIWISILHRDVRNQPIMDNNNIIKYINFKGFTFHIVSTLECNNLMSDKIEEYLNGGIGKGCGIVFETPQQAYSAAFDYILNNLI